MRPFFAYQELEQLFACTVGRGLKSVAFTASHPGTGVTLLSLLLAQRVRASGRSVLLVDLNLRSPSIFGARQGLRVAWSPEDPLETLPVVASADYPGIVYLPAPKESDALLRFRDTAKLRGAISTWRRSYDCVIVDTSPLYSTCFRNITPEAVCAATDATVLVVMAGEDSEQRVCDAAQRLMSGGADLVGSVINDCRNPRLADELCRETRRLEWLVPGLMARTRHMVRNSGFLNAAV